MIVTKRVKFKIPSIWNLHNIDEIAFEAFCSIGTLFIEA